MSDQWKSVKGSGATWEPKQTGSKKGKDLVALTANDKSFVIGYYMGSEYGLGKDNNSTAHKIQLTEAGDPAHFTEPVEKDQEFSVWGTAVLNDQISKTPPGTHIKILWQGKQDPKNAGGNQYHGWEVFIDQETEPLKVGPGYAADSKTEQASVSPATEEGVPAGVVDEDDDIPF